MNAKEQKEHRRWRIGLLFTGASLLLSVSVFGYTVWRDRSAAESNGERFAKIETSLRILTEAVAPQLHRSIDDSLHRALSADPANLHKALDSTRDVISQLQASKATPDAGRTAAVGKVLADVTLAHSDSVEPWKVAAQFISFKYQGSPPNLGNCVERPFDNFKVPDPNGMGSMPGAIPTYLFAFHDCTLVIDDVAALQESEPYARYQLAMKIDGMVGFSISLLRVHVVYRGGQLPKAFYLFFQDCTFEWDEPVKVPLEPEKRVMRGLLLANLGEKSKIPIDSGM